MQLVIQLDTESARQLAAIQKYTNQDHNTVIQQVISLYYQQIQPHYRVRIEEIDRYELVGSETLTASAIN
jgi:hypothetical protein